MLPRRQPQRGFPCLALLTGLLAVCACGRSQPLRYDGGSIVPYPDAGIDGGHKVGCLPGDLPLTRATPVVTFVLDRSGSMNDPFGGTTRWRALRDALETSLPPVDSKMAVGALVFPSETGDSCGVSAHPELSPALNNVSALINLMRQTFPAGHTPTADAIRNGSQSLLSTHAATRARAMVLATDGAPNCNAMLDPQTCTCSTAGFCSEAILCLDDVLSVTEVTQANAEGVPTWVIGIQDDNVTDITVLDQLAVAGGHPRADAGERFYAADSPQALLDALTEIRDQVGNCVYLSGSVPPDDGSIVITLGGLPIVHGDGGWDWSNKDNGELVLEEPACGLSLANPSAALEAQVICHVTDGGTDGGVDGGTQDGG